MYNTGIDVSEHNGEIDWEEIRRAGIAFAIIRLGWGRGHLDRLFYEHINGALAAGLPVGVYYYSYADTPKAAEDEARKQQEIEQARLTAEANFNEATGAYSGTYGSVGADGAHKEQINAILAEKDDALRDLIQRTGEE